MKISIERVGLVAGFALGLVACDTHPTMYGDSQLYEARHALTGGQTFIGCTTEETARINAAVGILLDICSTRFETYSACLGDAAFVEANGTKASDIAGYLCRSTITTIRCADLKPGRAGEAPVGLPFWWEDISLDKEYVGLASATSIAGTIGHELMHNRGFRHEENDRPSRLYPLTVPAQVAACITSGRPNLVLPLSVLTDRRVFDPAFYLAIHPDLAAAFGTNLEAANDHWVNQGIKEGRRSAIHFDVRYYLNRYPDLRAAFGANYAAALDHWLQQGLPNEGRRGSREFDVRFYLASHSDLQAAFGTNYQAAADHWISHGAAHEGRRGAYDFAVRFYLSAYPDLSQAFGTDFRRAMLHWITNGAHEGRRGSP